MYSHIGSNEVQAAMARARMQGKTLPNVEINTYSMRPGRRNFNVYGTVGGEQGVFGELVPGCNNGGKVWVRYVDRVADCLSMDIANPEELIVFLCAMHAWGAAGAGCDAVHAHRRDSKALKGAEHA